MLPLFLAQWTSDHLHLSSVLKALTTNSERSPAEVIIYNVIAIAKILMQQLNGQGTHCPNPSLGIDLGLKPHWVRPKLVTGIVPVIPSPHMAKDPARVPLLYSLSTNGHVALYMASPSGNLLFPN